MNPGPCGWKAEILPLRQPRRRIFKNQSPVHALYVLRIRVYLIDNNRFYRRTENGGRTEN